MSERVVIAPNPARVKFSIPGVDADAATRQQLLFDSTGGKYIGVAEQGFVATGGMAMTRFDNVGGRYYQEFQQIIPLQKTYGAPPHFLMCAKDPNAPSFAGRDGVTCNISFSNVGPSAGSRYRLYGETSVNEMRLFAKFFIMSLPVPATPFADIAYLVFQK